MSQEPSVTTWFDRLQDGNRDALQKLWERYSDRLIEFTSDRLRRSPKRLGDEHDVANSVFLSLYRCAAAGQLRSVKNRDELWWLLLAMARRKAIDHQRREGAAKRGASLTYSPTDGEGERSWLGGFTLEDLITEEPSPDSLTMLQETLDLLLAALPDEPLRRIALLRLEGHSTTEIAQLQAVSCRTIERKLGLIRKNWSVQLCAYAD